MSEIKVFTATFNCGKIRPNFFHKDIQKIHPKNEHYDIYAFAFQEMNPLLHQTNVKAASEILTKLSHSLLNVLGDDEYTLLGKSSIGQIGLVVIIRTQWNFKLEDFQIIHTTGFPCGHLGTTLKGATGLRFQYMGEGFTFISMHLNAGEKKNHLKRRLSDLEDILEKMKFEDGTGVVVKDYHCFLMGDFNFRCTGGHGMLKAGGNRSQTLNSELENFPSVWGTLERSVFLSKAREHDELKLQMQRDDNDHGTAFLDAFEEADIHFDPSYKKVMGTNELVPNRIPSYCDRILFTKSVPRINVIKYSTPDFPQDSDHSMVYLIAKVSKGATVAGSIRSQKSENITLPYQEIIRRAQIRDAILGWLIYIKETKRGKILLAGMAFIFFFTYKYLLI